MWRRGAPTPGCTGQAPPPAASPAGQRPGWSPRCWPTASGAARQAARRAMNRRRSCWRYWIARRFRCGRNLRSYPRCHSEPKCSLCRDTPVLRHWKFIASTMQATEVGTKHSTCGLRYRKFFLKWILACLMNGLEDERKCHYMSQELMQRLWHDLTHLSALKYKLYYTRLYKWNYEEWLGSYLKVCFFPQPEKWAILPSMALLFFRILWQRITPLGRSTL